MYFLLVVTLSVCSVIIDSGRLQVCFLCIYLCIGNAIVGSFSMIVGFGRLLLFIACIPLYQH